MIRPSDIRYGEWMPAGSLSFSGAPGGEEDELHRDQIAGWIVENGVVATYDGPWADED